MTREEAIADIRDNIKPIVGGKSLEMAIKALEQQPCDDVISRQALDEIKELMTDINGDTVYAVRMSNIRQLPSVTPQPKMGEWLKNGELCKCSNCHSNVLFSAIKFYNYCYRCGAKMEVET